MNKTELTRTVKEMIAAPSCCQELKAAGQNYLNAVSYTHLTLPTIA